MGGGKVVSLKGKRYGGSSQVVARWVPSRRVYHRDRGVPCLTCLAPEFVGVRDKDAVFRKSAVFGKIAVFGIHFRPSTVGTSPYWNAT